MLIFIYKYEHRYGDKLLTRGGDYKYLPCIEYVCSRKNLPLIRYLYDNLYKYATNTMEILDLLLENDNYNFTKFNESGILPNMKDKLYTNYLAYHPNTDINVFTYQSEITAIHSACMYRYSEFVRYILSLEDINVNIKMKKIKMITFIHHYTIPVILR